MVGNRDIRDDGAVKESSVRTARLCMRTGGLYPLSDN
jgi:hypothetical protein